MLATGVGSMPGLDAADFDDAIRLVLDALVGDRGVPHLPEVPGRGPAASMTGRALAVVADLGFDLQPAGWRLTDAPGVDHRRARSLLAQDLDRLEEAAQGYTGPFKIQVAGPWTVAATVERPRGDRLLADHGARREVAQALAEGLGAHVADVRRRVGGADRLVVQVDEPALAAVLDGRVPTASGYGRHRSVDRPELSATLAAVLEAAAAAGAEPWVHSCAADVPWELVRGAGARGLSADLALLSPAGHDVLAAALEDGEAVALGVVPATDPTTYPSDAQVVETARRWLDMLGLDPESVRDRLVLTPTCGLAGASAAWARAALALTTKAAASLS
ncbi:methionine synthase [Nocardioides sp.]|uniref:methionine synthase n=1 Tax=Nocardioides sp. TaxID=35761 RepID=UPI003526D121